MRLNRYVWTPATVSDLGRSPEPPEHGGYEYLGNFTPADRYRGTITADTPVYVEIPGCSGSDYAGDYVTVSNHRVWLRDLGGVDVYGGYGTYTVFVREGARTEEMDDALEGMEDYAVLDEDDATDVEMEAQDDAWENWARADYQRALIARFPDREEEVWSLDDEALRGNFDETREREALDWINETGNRAWIDVERVAAATDLH